MVEVQISLSARDDLESLPESVQDRIKTKLLNDVTEDPGRHLRSMSGTEYSSIRVGDYRLVVDYTDDELRILAVGHRSTIYDRDW